MARLWAGSGRLASLREDYLSQVQRVFSQSRRGSLRAPTPLANAPRPRAEARANFRASRRDAEQLVQLGARRRVLQRLRALRVDELADRERGERRLVEAADDELLLARVGVDVADREDPRRRGLEARRVDDDLLLLERQAPVGDRPELRAPAEQDEERVERQLARVAVAAEDGAARRACRRSRRSPSGRPATNSTRPDERSALRRARVASSASKSSRRWTSVTLPAAPRLPRRGDRRRDRRGGAADDDDALAGVLVQGRARARRAACRGRVEAVDLAGAAGTSRRRRRRRPPWRRSACRPRSRRRSGRRRAARPRSPAGRDESRRRTARSA